MRTNDHLIRLFQVLRTLEGLLPFTCSPFHPWKVITLSQILPSPLNLPIFVKMKQQSVFIITGGQGEGKTTRIVEVVDALRDQNIEACGFVAPGKWKADTRVDFSIKNINTGETKLLCQDKPAEGFQKIGRFYFNPEAIKFGESILLMQNGPDKELIVIDEIGLFELDGHVWADVLKQLLNSNLNPLLITVRKKFVEDVIENFNLRNVLVFNFQLQPTEIVQKILKELSSA